MTPAGARLALLLAVVTGACAERPRGGETPVPDQPAAATAGPGA